MVVVMVVVVEEGVNGLMIQRRVNEGARGIL